MSGTQRIAARRPLLRAPTFRAGNALVGGLAFALAAAVCAFAAGATGAIYHALAYGGAGPVARFAGFGLGIACLYAFSFLVRGEYAIAVMLAGARNPRRVFTAWNMAFLAAVVVAFLTKTSDDVSRGFTMLFYGIGLLAMFAVEAGTHSAVLAGLRSGRIASRRIVVVGTPEATRTFIERLHASEDGASGLRVVAVASLGENVRPPTNAALIQAASTARKTRADDIVIAASLEDEPLIEACVAAFSELPVSVHLDGTSIADRAVELRLHRLGGATTIALAEHPLSSGQAAAKRAFDLVIAGAALVALLPIMVAIGLAVRLDTPGPALFRQRRLGHNQRPFTIYKFRSMTVAEDGTIVRQATTDDPRITRVGHWLRRFNLDELPQLWNVVRGEMSLVGPRPHAIAHDDAYQRRIASYFRRLNVKPGITGWAQVNGHRGETDTDEKMRTRVEHDLYYIDNWSLAFDAYIMLLTVVSPKAYRNAR